MYHIKCISEVDPYQCVIVQICSKEGQLDVRYVDYNMYIDMFSIIIKHDKILMNSSNVKNCHNEVC